MPSKKKSFIDKSSAVKFQLVQRSLRDPLYNDPDAPKMVLMPMKQKSNSKNINKMRNAAEYKHDLISDLPPELLAITNDEQDEEEFYDNLISASNQNNSGVNDDDLDDLEEYETLLAQLQQMGIEDINDLKENQFDFDPSELADFKNHIINLKSRIKTKSLNNNIIINDNNEDLIDVDKNIYSTNKLVYPEDTPNLQNDPASHGIYFDDQNEYDYMKHLKPVGLDPNSIVVDAVAEKQTSQSLKNRKNTPVFLKEDLEKEEPVKQQSRTNVGGVSLGDDFLPSKEMISLDAFHNPNTVESVFDVPQNVREVLYALEDEEFIDDNLDDDFFDNLNAEIVDEELEAKLMEETRLYEENLKEKGKKDDTIFDEEWHQDFVKFKQEQELLPSINSDDDLDSLNNANISERPESLDDEEALELLDQLGPLPGEINLSIPQQNDEPSTPSYKPEPRNLPKPSKTGTIMSVGGTRYTPLRRRKASSAMSEVSSALSMSSSALFRNNNLTNLDDCFDKILEEYSDEELGELDSGDEDVRGDNTVEKDEMEEMLESFMNSTEIRGKFNTVIDKRLSEHQSLVDIQNELRDVTKKVIHKYLDQDTETLTEQEQEELDATLPQEKVYDNWDVESVLSNYSNIYNRPQILTVNSVKKSNGNISKIRVKNDKRGMPVIQEIDLDGNITTYSGNMNNPNNNSDEDSDIENDEPKINKGTRRNKKETKEEKKLRKQAVKEEKKNRRSEKKLNKEYYNI